MSAMTIDELRRILVSCAGDGGTLSAGAEILDTPFTDLGYDSLALIETAARIDQEFGVTISDDAVAELVTPAEMLDAVNALLGGAETTPRKPVVYRTHHSILVNAPVDRVYAILADVIPAPTLFSAPVYYRHIEKTERTERFRIWVLANGEIANWISVRRLNPDSHVIVFEQEETHPLISAMRGEFRMSERPGGQTEVLLDHEFVPADDDPAKVALIERATEANSTGQLTALRAIAELSMPLDELLFSTEDSVEVQGTAADAYEFVYQAQEWPNRLLHIAEVNLREMAPGAQHMEKITVGPDGTRHSSTSVRLCFTNERIVFKQVPPPSPLRGNAGEWTFTPAPGGSTITVRHTVLLDPDSILSMLGTNTTLAEARDRIREVIASTGRHTLLGAKHFAEQRAPEEAVK